MALDAAAWAEIERLYRTGVEPISNIAIRFGIGVRSIHAMRKARGWPPRCGKAAAGARRKRMVSEPKRTRCRGEKAANPGRAPAGDAAEPGPVVVGVTVDAAARETSTPPVNASPPPAAKPATRKALVRRLYRAIDVKLQRLERRMTSGEEPTIADSERETRELAHMIRSFEKVTEVAADIAQDTGRHASKPAGGSARAAARKQPAEAYVSADAERMRHEIAQRLERLHRARAAGK